VRIHSVLPALALALSCSSAFAAGPITAPRTVPMVVANIKAMQINDIIRLKVENAKDFEAAGIKGLGVGDDVEVRKIGADKLEVKRLSTGQVGVMQAQ